jgi:hypothetical protein
VCRALKVFCLAADSERLAELKRASVAAEWELCAGSTDPVEASKQLDEERPHVLVVAGDFAPFVASVRRAYPAMRIVADRELPEVDAVVASLGQLRETIGGVAHPGGPVRRL